MSRIHLALFASLLAAIALVFVNPLAELSTRYNQEAAVTAGSMYAGYRVINRATSMVSDAEMQAGVGVASITFSPGRVLQSLIDSLQRFADILFALMIVSGVLSVVLAPLATIAAAIGALGFALAIVFVGLKPVANGFRQSVMRLSRALAGIGVLGAVIVPAAYSGGYVLGDAITAEAWNRSVAAFATFSAEIESAEETLIDIVVDDDTGTDTEEQDQGGNFLTDLADAISSGAGAAVDAAAGAIGGAARAGDQAARLFGSIPDMLARSGEIVSASLQFLTAYLIKLLVLPLVIGGILIWTLRQTFRSAPVYYAPPLIERRDDSAAREAGSPPDRAG